MGPAETEREGKLAALEQQAATLKARLRLAHAINRARLEDNPRDALAALGLSPVTIDVMEDYGIPSTHIHTLGHHLRAVEAEMKELMREVR